MFLVRAVFWLAVVMALLPEQRDEFLSHWPYLQQQARARGADVWLEQTKERAENVVAVCRYDPSLCRDAGDMWSDALEAAYAHVQQVLQTFSADGTDEPPLRRRDGSNGTLKPADLEPAWDAPRSGRKV